MLKQPLAQLAQRGYQSRMVSIHRLSDLQEAIDGQCRQGLVDRELYDTYLAAFDFDPPDSLPEASSILVMASPEPPIRLLFHWDGEEIPALVPPTYGERKKDRHARELLAQAMEATGYRIAQASVPKKLLAVRSGLATYGRNNVTYVPGMGSFFSLTAVYTDLPVSQDTWQELQMMDSCQNCSACLRHCPAGAITSERFLAYAERCITFHNEKPADVPFPAWIDPTWHNCLVGCLQCQQVCPANKEVWRLMREGAAFSHEETALLLQGLPFDQLPSGTADKLERLDLDTFLDIFPRNLSVLLSQRRLRTRAFG
jgi:epoxyqueuosine reductase